LSIKFWLFIILGTCIALPLGWLLFVRYEATAPVVALEPLPDALGVSSQDLTLSVSDAKTGIRRLRVVLLREGVEKVLLEKEFPWRGFFQGGSVHQSDEPLKVETGKLDWKDGKATLRIVAWDFAWRHWGKGNVAELEKEVTIDTRPPDIGVLSRNHNLSPGGAGLIIYRLSEPCPQSGVQVGDNFFPGHSGQFKDPAVFMAFFALDHTQGPGTELLVTAVDAAGNRTRRGFVNYIRKKTFRKDVINVSEGFLSQNLPEFAGIPPESAGSPIDKFLWVNRDLRAANYRKIVDVCAHTRNEMLWDGPFLRLPKAARRAGFADAREYSFQGRVVDHQYHLGVDLASNAHSPVPAANRGRVAFAGPLGIYGNVVLIDHGFGLFSMYAHLSSFDVQVDQILAQGDIIGRTGSTGLAGGDHLHFAVMIHNLFVNPIEWWDGSWIQNNITAKIEDVRNENK
jgi:hypothetical protein